MYVEASIFDNKNNPKEMWKFINSVISNKGLRTTPVRELIVDGKAFVDPVNISEQFNNYFVKIGQTIPNSVNRISNSNFKSFLKNSVSQTIVFDPPNPNEIYCSINALNLNKACGYDNIAAHFLRLGNDVLSPMLATYFGMVFERGVFPKFFKIANVIPLYKTDSKCKQLSPNFSSFKFIKSSGKIN